jgi:hypothetical protein
MRQPSSALLALSVLVANEPTSLERLAMIRENIARDRKPSGKDRSKQKAARKQRQKHKR